VHQIRFQLGLQRFSRPLAGLRGPNSEKKGDEREGEKGEEGERKGRGETGPPFANPGSTPEISVHVITFINSPYQAIALASYRIN